MSTGRSAVRLASPIPLAALALAAVALAGCAAPAPDLCDPSPCEHGGLCISGDDGVACACPVGYAGARCEEDADDCAPDPCFHGGTCTDSVGGFTCACAPGFSGVQCQDDEDDCGASPCANGGVCVDGVDGFACACMPGFTGESCEIDVDDCDPDPCFAGTCADGVDSFTCTCEPGFWGPVCDAEAEPLAVVVPSSFAPALVGVPYSVSLARTGGTARAAWSIVPGGTNTEWLSIDPATGALTGTPSSDAIGPVEATVRVEEAWWPENAAEATLALAVIAIPPPAYETSFEGTCPDGWTLTGDWECGVPANVGPATAATGAQCIATRIASRYTPDESWDGTTATSPEVALPAGVPERLEFRAWVHTEGSTYDGFQVQVSADGGATFSALTEVSPAYSLVVDGRPAWGGDESALGWQRYEADLSAYQGQTVRIRFAFRSDASAERAGVYIDDVVVAY